RQIACHGCDMILDVAEVQTNLGPGRNFPMLVAPFGKTLDDITDVYAPLVQVIEDEVDEIDYEILALHSSDENSDDKAKNSAKAKELEYEKMSKVAGSDTQSEKGERTAGDSGGDMLRRVGNCRKKVMSLYRLLGNKADVIKGFAKRCNEHWEVAPRSEIGLYLGDIQDHVATMTGNLS
ncbi:hypothetical protein KCU64_g23574, partial [Aureobasidium melanogenum]